MMPASDADKPLRVNAIAYQKADAKQFGYPTFDLGLAEGVAREDLHFDTLPIPRVNA